ncbi:MAG: nucleotide exchange factor GrpE [Ruminiclostridium sp.]|nr:nucleotide exchange factor GrpE [Ruminiclostridium sp.]
MSQRKKDMEQKELNNIETNAQENEQESLNCDIENGENIDNSGLSDLDKKEEEINCLKDQLQRIAAEFDNFKKRTIKEKEKLYDVSIAESAAIFLPVLDNVELALKASESSNEKSIREGVDMIHRQFQEALAGLGVKYIEVLGEKFDPQLHEAVMHIEDEEYGDNEIVEEFRKGYIYKNGIVIRHSVVKVAN